MKHLDKALCNPSWHLLLSETIVLHLPKTSSNHHPILINSSPSNLLHANRPFRLETIWFSDLSFPKITQDSWNSHLEDAILALKDFTNKIRIWNRNVFGNIFQKKTKSLLVRLNGIQTALFSNHSPFLTNLEKNLNMEFQHILKLEEELWAVKSRTEWTLLGDCNTKFFHLSTIRR